MEKKLRNKAQKQTQKKKKPMIQEKQTEHMWILFVVQLFDAFCTEVFNFNPYCQKRQQMFLFQYIKYLNMLFNNKL